MDLPATDSSVWPALEATARALAERCDVYAIACNTLNVYAPRLHDLSLPARLITPPDAVASWAEDEGIDAVGLLGARPVATLTDWSPYASLAEGLRVETPPDVDGLHELILDIKADGGAAPSHADRLAALALEFDTRHLLLACTELPLVAIPVNGKVMVDPTDLVAAELVRCWSELAAS